MIRPVNQTLSTDGRRFPKAIFYDSKGTLWEWPDKSWVEVSAQILRKYPGARATPEELGARWRLFFLPERNAFRDDHFRDFNSLMEEALILAGESLGVPCRAEDAKGMDYLILNLKPFSDTVAALTEQQELGVKIMTFTNAMKDHIEGMVAKLSPFKPDYYGCTEEARLHKPNPLLYRWVLQKNGLSVDDVIYCANPWFDVQGAKATGMKVAWINRPGQVGGGESRDYPASPDWKVGSLHELTKIVKSLLRR
jgi:2-haloacid dehalogenase